MNRINNPGFSGNTNNWTLSGNAAYIASQGNDELGAASLPDAGSAISQQFTITMSRPQMADVYVKGTGSGNLTMAITNGDGDTVYSNTLTVTTSWANALGQRVGLPQGTYTLTLTYDDVACYVDDVSVAWVIKTRAELASEAANLLGDLASTDAGYSTTPSGDDTEGDYTKAVDAALRAVSAVDDAGRPDVRELTEDNVDACVDEVQRYMLHKLHRYYARNATDFSLEGRTEHYHQRVAAIENLLGIAVGGRPSASGRAVVTRKLIHRDTL